MYLVSSSHSEQLWYSAPQWECTSAFRSSVGTPCFAITPAARSLSLVTACVGGPQPGALGSGECALAVALGTPQPNAPGSQSGGPHRPLPPFAGCG